MFNIIQNHVSTFTLIVFALLWTPAHSQSSSSSHLCDIPFQTIVDWLDDAPNGWQTHVRHMINTKFQPPSYDALLSELVRRGGDESQRMLAEKLSSDGRKLIIAEERMQKLVFGSQAWLAQQIVVARLRNNLELLTALHRAEGKRDPLTIVVTIPDEGLMGGTRVPPTFDVALKNVSLNKNAIWIKKGGDYRSGRQARWRIHVWDSDGQLMKTRPRDGLIGGGAVSHGSLDHGERWHTQLALDDYVDIRKPGRYKVQVFYHNELPIADLTDQSDLSNLILVQSMPFDLTVTQSPPLEIRLAKGSNRIAQSHIGQLGEKDELRIVLGEYGPVFHDFVSPDSAQGELLSMGEQALPALLTSLEDKGISLLKRAQILALLYSITNERDLDPMKMVGVLPSYSWRSRLCRGQHYQIGAICAKKQLKLAERWLDFRKEYLRTVPPNGRP